MKELKNMQTISQVAKLTGISPVSYTHLIRRNHKISSLISYIMSMDFKFL